MSTIVTTTAGAVRVGLSVQCVRKVLNKEEEKDAETMDSMREGREREKFGEKKEE